MKSENKIRDLLNQIGENADAETQFALARCYSGNFKDKEEAAKLYRKAAEKGNIEALVELGLCHLHGDGVDFNEWKGMKLLKKAAEKGNTEALYEIGRYYEEYYDDTDKGLPYYRKAAELGNVRAQESLGYYYYEINEKEEAAKWLTKAAENGVIDAIETLEHLNEQKKH